MKISNFSFKRKYRVIKEWVRYCDDESLLYVPQYKDWWWPFWQFYSGMYGCDHWFCHTPADAEAFIKTRKHYDSFKTGFIYE